ncbi:TPA: hypothetical protein QDZ28_004319 [Pseudomonas putida]|nr:hypothetical protein [Pseudomonas putida]
MMKSIEPNGAAKMAALHDFRFILRKASFKGNLVFPAAGSASILIEECKLMTYADAQAHLAKLSSAAQSVSHSAMLSMKYRVDRKPRGWNQHPNRIDYEAPIQGV